ncbi:MAG: hypothetical protein COV52_02865 [Gammaproteobacteria bacterium CG11_big_fil_rev_8_21_14_0_20_46_22]|nr:MAG: hypothetical protein COW05_02195 [Gammaproteobacteria bacterium CG12_big_fil_rev_8_21_14_0_65_46_12]PIR11716.1 MAG: hypothetical protein COV52_02865 [Gammaproteobacteria bacterium CG11_big_fil_rev_8_21_14_0_20_46_22]
MLPTPSDNPLFGETAALLQAPSATPLAEALDRLRVMRNMESSLKARIAARVIAGVLTAAAPIVFFGVQSILAALYSSKHLLFFSENLVRLGYWFGVTLFAIINNTDMGAAFLHAINYIRHGGLRLDLKKFKEKSRARKAAHVFSMLLFDLPMLALGLASCYGAAAGVFDAYKDWYQILLDGGFAPPQILTVIGSLVSAFGTNMLYMLANGLWSGMKTIAFNLSQYLAPCRPSRYSKGFIGYRAIDEARRRFANMEDKHLGHAVAVVNVYGEVLKETNRPNAFINAPEIANQSFADQDRLYEYYAVYCAMRKLESYSQYRPNRGFVGLWFVLNAICGLAVGLTGSLTNGIGGIDEGSYFLGIASLVANVIINTSVAVMLPRMFYEISIKPIYQLIARCRSPEKDPIRGPAMVLAGWAMKVFWMAAAAFPAIMTFAGTFGVTLEMEGHVSFLNVLPFAVQLLLSITPAAALCALVLYAVMNKLASLFVTPIRNRLYGEGVANHLGSLTNYVNNLSEPNGRVKKVARATTACGQFSAALERYQQWTGALSEKERNAQACFFGRVYETGDSTRVQAEAKPVTTPRDVESQIPSAHRFFATSQSLVPGPQNQRLCAAS